MKGRFKWMPAFLMLAFALPGNACTIFMYHKDGRTLFGNNEDYNLKANIWFNPGKPGEYGRITFGWDNGWSQGGMNERGLVYDWAATGQQSWVYSDLKAPDCGYEVRGSNQICELMMATCASVGEAVQLFQSINDPSLGASHIIITDSTGTSVIIEWGTDDLVIIPRDTCFQICTNFNITNDTDLSKVTPRYHEALAWVSGLEELRVDYFRRALKAVSQGGTYGTKYANIYDIQKGLIYLYNGQNYNEYLVLDLKEELAKGDRSYKVNDLFACIEPWSPLNYDTIPAGTVKLRWSGKGMKYELKYSEDSLFEGYSSKIVDMPEDPLLILRSATIEGLKPESKYFWKLQGSCTEGFYTDMIPFVFYTGTATHVNTIGDPGGMNIYPVPARETLTIETRGIIKGQFNIDDLSGKRIISGDFYDDKFTLDLRDLDPGYYLLILSTKDNSVQATIFAVQ